ncbi:hypothetical protein ABNC06_20970, partial [Paenibacillus larvae]
RAMNMAPFIFWNLAFYTIIRTQLKSLSRLSNHNNILFLVETNQDNVIREDNDFAELEEVQIIQL